MNSFGPLWKIMWKMSNQSTLLLAHLYFFSKLYIRSYLLYTTITFRYLLTIAPRLRHRDTLRLYPPSFIQNEKFEISSPFPPLLSRACHRPCHRLVTDLSSLTALWARVFTLFPSQTFSRGKQNMYLCVGMSTRILKIGWEIIGHADSLIRKYVYNMESLYYLSG